MKYFSRAGIYKNSTGNNIYDPNTNKAWSYDWWLYCTIYKGKLIFNNTRYSSTTNKHQNATYNLLTDKPDIILYNTTTNLENIEYALRAEVIGLKHRIHELITKIKTPRSRRLTNDNRRKVITQHVKKISTIRAILDA